MAIERTFSIIKPNAVAKNVIGSIFSRFEAAGFKIVGTKMLHLTVEQARGFYAEHEGRPFFDGLVEFMTSGPIVVSVLEGENAVQRHRDLLGATNPAPRSHSYLCSRGLMRGSCLSPEASLRLVKFVPDEFVTCLPPCDNRKALED